MLIGFIVWALMQSVGEVTTMFPIAGGFVEVRDIRVLTSIDKANKFPQHAGRFVDPAFSFAMAWMYYFMWSVFLGSGKKYAIPLAHNGLTENSHRMERCNIDPTILGTRRENALIRLGDCILGLLLHPHHPRRCGLRRDRVLFWMVQNYFVRCVLLHLIPRQCWCIREWIYRV
jgi:hypothetical protein